MFLCGLRELPVCRVRGSSLHSWLAAERGHVALTGCRVGAARHSMNRLSSTVSPELWFFPGSNATGIDRSII